MCVCICVGHPEATQPCECKRPDCYWNAWNSLYVLLYQTVCFFNPWRGRQLAPFPTSSFPLPLFHFLLLLHLLKEHSAQFWAVKQNGTQEQKISDFGHNGWSASWLVWGFVNRNTQNTPLMKHYCKFSPLPSLYLLLLLSWPDEPLGSSQGNNYSCWVFQQVYRLLNKLKIHLGICNKLSYSVLH